MVLVCAFAACGTGAGDGHGDGGDIAADAPTDRFEPQICDTNCPPPPPEHCPQPNGSVALPMEIEPLHVLASGDLDPIVDGDHLRLEPPFQGGRVIYIAVRAHNITDGCNVSITGALRDPLNDRVLGLEMRTTAMVTGADGWATPVSPYINSFANVPLCPNAAADRDLDGNTWQIELRLQEPSGRSATVTRTIALDCTTGGFMDCACECDSDYVLGGPCPFDGLDAGVGD
jgi:hypothetical protein